MIQNSPEFADIKWDHQTMPIPSCGLPSFHVFKPMTLKQKSHYDFLHGLLLDSADFELWITPDTANHYRGISCNSAIFIGSSFGPIIV
jgi:hypothetical protein